MLFVNREERIEVSPGQNPGFSGLPEGITSRRNPSVRWDRYQSLRLTERKRLVYHTGPTEARLGICDLPKSGIFRIAGGHNFAQDPECALGQVPIASSHREEAIGISHGIQRGSVAPSARFGQAPWSSAVVERCGQAPWSSAVVERRGRALWSSAVVERGGRAPWSTPGGRTRYF
ncbi:hypothetical protein Ddc_19893 [Ditylenchus destructor]|nr:hypothetical protein Ddc_19893 [Ditylenchus destructor]